MNQWQLRKKTAMNKQDKIKALRQAINQIYDPGRSDFDTECVLDIYEQLLDEHNIESENYRGLASFWGYRYKHYLHSATMDERMSVRREFDRFGLELDKESELHDDIVKRVLKLREI